MAHTIAFFGEIPERNGILILKKSTLSYVRVFYHQEQELDLGQSVGNKETNKQKPKIKTTPEVS